MRSSFTSGLVAWRAVSPARRRLPASRNSFDQPVAQEAARCPRAGSARRCCPRRVVRRARSASFPPPNAASGSPCGCPSPPSRRRLSASPVSGSSPFLGGYDEPEPLRRSTSSNGPMGADAGQLSSKVPNSLTTDTGRASSSPSAVGRASFRRGRRHPWASGTSPSSLRNRSRQGLLEPEAARCIVGQLVGQSVEADLRPSGRPRDFPVNRADGPHEGRYLLSSAWMAPTSSALISPIVVTSPPGCATGGTAR